MATLNCTLNGVRYNNAAGSYTDWSSLSYSTSGAAYIGWVGASGMDCATVFKFTVPSDFSGISSRINVNLEIQNQVDNGGPTTLNWSLAKTDAYITGNKYADGSNYPLVGNGEIASGTISFDIRHADYQEYTFAIDTSAITAGGTYYLIMYRHNDTGVSTQYPSSVTIEYIDNYYVSYNANGGTTTPATQTKTHDVALKLAGAIYKRNSASKVKTTFDANGGSVSPASVESVVTTSYPFAGWKASNGTLYSASGSYTANEDTEMTAQWGSSVSVAGISLPTPTRAGHTFLGWYTAASGGTKVTSYSPTENSTLYAHWSINEYSLNVSCGKGASVTVMRGGSALSDGAVLTYGDVLVVNFAASPEYKLTSTSHANGSTITVTEDVSVYATADVLSYSIGNGTTMEQHHVCIGNGTSYDKYVAYIGNGKTWDLYE